jgi:hypothetical protein
MKPIPGEIKGVLSILTLCLVAVSLIHCAGEGVEETSEWVSLEMSDEWQSRWAFLGGEWQQDAEGVMAAPENVVDENLAFHTPEVYRDFEAEFEFRWDIFWTTAGFAFRAQDARHYYILDFPAVGQHYRAEHFWVTLSKVDERGWREGLHMEMLHGVSSMPTLWHKARIRVEGEEIRVWVDGRPAAAVRDTTYAKAGRIGLVTYSGSGATAKTRFRNLKVRGQSRPASSWDESLEPVRNWFVVDSQGGTGCSNIIRAQSGELLVVTPRAQLEGGSWQAEPTLLASQDNGRTWSAKAEMPKKGRWSQKVGGLEVPRAGDPSPQTMLRAAPGGRLECYLLSAHPPLEVERAISTDEGLSWSDLQPLGDITLPSEPPVDSLVPTSLLEIEEGVLLMFAYARTRTEDKQIRGRRYIAPAGQPIQSRVSLAGMNLCLRSTDGGDTWSEPINIDGPPHDNRFWQIPRGASEIGAALTREGKILVLVRPYEPPLMWEGWSEDGGRTWTPLMRGPFPMWACNKSTISTESGTLMVGGRFPGLAVQMSQDSGMTWDFYVIDNTMWANGAMFQVEPDLVLFIYGGHWTPSELRGQFLRVTSTGLEPERF